MNKINMDISAILFEHRFWLQVLGDHSRFIFTTLAPKEQNEIMTAQQFIQLFDHYLNLARKELTLEETAMLTEQVYPHVLKLKEFKLHLIRRHLQQEIAIGLSPSFINHMVNELEEYERILTCLLHEHRLPIFHSIHHHLLWLQDAYGHSSSISASLDMIEKRLKEKSNTYTKHFEDFYLKAIELAGYLRTNLQEFPALSRFNHQVELEMKMFMGFLKDLEELEISNEVLGTLSPLMADHMAREECYYLTKLSGVSDIPKPSCNPAHPRQDN